MGSTIGYTFVPSVEYFTYPGITKTRTFPGADIGSDHDLTMVVFRVRLKGYKKAKNNTLKFNLLKDPHISSVEGRIGANLVLYYC